MDSSAHERILKPLLEITYEEIPVSMIGPTTKTGLHFEVDYF